MFGFSLGSRKGHTVAVAFAGSASAGCAIVHVDSARITVLASAYVSLLLTTPPEASAVSALVNEVCTKAAQNYAASSTFRTHGPVQKTYGIIHAPWMQSRSARVQQTFETPTNITDAHIQALGQKALGEASQGGTPFESSVVRVELNGYPVSSPKGKKTSTVSVVVLASTADAEIEKGLRTALTHTFPVPAVLRSDTRALLSMVEHEGQLRDYVLMHITNEATLCVVVRDGIPTEIQALPVGTRALTRSLGTTDDTSSQLRLAMKDMCADDACRAIHTALATAEPDLAKKYGQGFAPITTIRRMPENVVLIAHPDFSQWYASFLSRIDFAPFTVTTRPFRISTPAVLESHSFIMWTAGLKEEVALVEALAFVNSEYKSSLHV